MDFLSIFFYIKNTNRYENGENLQATVTQLSINDKYDLIEKLIEQGYIETKEDVSLLLNLEVENFEGTATATFDVSKIANEGDLVAIYHYDESTSTWEYITTATVDSEGKVIGTFNSFSPIALLVSPINAHAHNIVAGECTECKYNIPGLYDANGELLCTLENSGMIIDTDYTKENYNSIETSPAYIISNNYPKTTKVITFL